MKKIAVPAKTVSIGNQAFYGCKNLTSATIGKGVTVIGKKVFYQCTRLTRIVIPAKVSAIGSKAFYGCSRLKSIRVKTVKLTSKNVGRQAFTGTPAKTKVKVPEKVWTRYQKLLFAKGIDRKATISK